MSRRSPTPGSRRTSTRRITRRSSRSPARPSCYRRILNSIGARIMGRVARFGVYVETIGTFGVFAALAALGFHQALRVHVLIDGAVEYSAKAIHSVWTSAATGGPVRHWSRFWQTSTFFTASNRPATSPKRQSTRSGRFPRRCATRCSTAASRRSCSCWACCSRRRRAGIGRRRQRRHRYASSPACRRGSQDFFFVMVIVAFFSCGTAVQGAGARVAFALARDGALPSSDRIKRYRRAIALRPTRS